MKFDKLLGITLQSGMKSLYVSRINVLLVSLLFSSLKVSGLPKLYARCLSTESNGISDCYCLPAESMRWCVCDCEVSKNWYLCLSGPSSLSWIMLTEMKYVWGSQKRIHWVLLSFNTSISSWNLECLICSGNPEKISSEQWMRTSYRVNPYVTLGPRIEPGSQRWEVTPSQYCSIPASSTCASHTPFPRVTYRLTV